LEGVIVENDAIKRKVGLLRQLVEKSGTVRDGEREEEDFGGSVGVGGGGSDDDDARSTCTIVPHELKRVEEDNEQMAREEQQQQQREEEETRRRRVERARLRTPGPTGFGDPHTPGRRRRTPRTTELA